MCDLWEKCGIYVDFINKLRECSLDIFDFSFHRLVSLDAVSLFTNIPIHLGLGIVNRGFDHIDVNIPKEHYLETASADVPIYYSFVDNIFAVIRENFIDALLEDFNDFHDRLKFTVDISSNNTVNFLDVNVSWTNNKFITNIRISQTNSWSGRYLSYLSVNPNKVKKSVVNSLVDRAILLSDSKFYRENIDFI